MSISPSIVEVLQLQKERKFLTECEAHRLEEGAIFNMKAKARALALAEAVVDAKGKLFLLKEAKTLLEKEGYIIEEEGYAEGQITRFFLFRLSQLLFSPSLRSTIASFRLPLSNTKMEEWIKILLQEEQLISDRQIVVAILSSFFTPLRQSVGSCFATAPAILIHEEYPEAFLSDLYSLCYKGHIKRTFGGLEFSVPMSPTAGFGELKQWFFHGSAMMKEALGHVFLARQPSSRATFLEVLKEEILHQFGLTSEDLIFRPSIKKEQIADMEKAFQEAVSRFVNCSDHLLLKVWEFTLASFTDVKTEFSKWNFFVSLGFQQEEEGGMRELIFLYFQKELDKANEKVALFQKEVEQAFDRLKAVESLMRGARSPSEGSYFEIEHRSALSHFYACEREREAWQATAEKIARFPSLFINQLIEKFPFYFQEIYDSQTLNKKEEGHIEDDTPGGFRLLYKHGRENPSAWTFIYTPEEYVGALQNFFSSIETLLWQEFSSEEEKKMLSEIILKILHWLQEESFLFSALARLNPFLKQRKTPVLSFKEIESLQKTPWVYLSGGTLFTLLHTYFRREKPFSVEKRKIESSSDLLVFILDTLKGLPPNIMDLFIQNPFRRMLMISPTHVFSLFPGLAWCKEGWEDPHFTYTWVRDKVIEPGQVFYKGLTLNPTEQIYLIERLFQRIPLLESHYVEKQYHPIQGDISLKRWGEEFLSVFPRQLKEEIEAFLFEMLPLSTQEKRAPLLEKLGIKEEANIRYKGKKELHDFLIHRYRGISNRDRHQEIADVMREYGLAPPSPFIFADTNWSFSFFGCIVNPLSLEFSLWRVDRIGLCGKPMNGIWSQYLHPDCKEEWTLLVDPREYAF